MMGGSRVGICLPVVLLVVGTSGSLLSCAAERGHSPAPPVAASPASGAVPSRVKPTLTELVRDTQKQSDTPEKLTLVWWVPEEFWSASFEQRGGVSQEQQDAFLQLVRPYLVVGVVDGKIGPVGGAEFSDVESVRAKLTVVDRKGGAYRPLPEAELPADVKNLASILQSVFANMAGALGEGMHFYFFPAAASDGTRVAEAAREGSFSVNVGEEIYKWHLPLGSLLALKSCPVDGEKLSGAWSYCPWHGKALVVAQ
jgi:hypothetical protein